MRFLSKSLMKIHFKTEGGLGFFPGLNKPLEIDSINLPEPEAVRLGELVAAATRDAGQNSRSGGVHKSGAADYKKYTVFIENEGHQDVLQFTDGTVGPESQELLNYLRGKEKEHRAALRGNNRPTS